MFIRIIIFLIGIALGVGCLRYTYQIVRTVGRSSWAEQHLGDTFNMWKIIGIVVIIGSTGYLFGLHI